MRLYTFSLTFEREDFSSVSSPTPNPFAFPSPPAFPCNYNHVYKDTTGRSNDFCESIRNTFTTHQTPLLLMLRLAEKKNDHFRVLRSR